MPIRCELFTNAVDNLIDQGQGGWHQDNILNKQSECKSKPPLNLLCEANGPSWGCLRSPRSWPISSFQLGYVLQSIYTLYVVHHTSHCCGSHDPIKPSPKTSLEKDHPSWHKSHLNDRRREEMNCEQVLQNGPAGWCHLNKVVETSKNEILIQYGKSDPIYNI